MKRTLFDWASVIGAAAASLLFCAYYFIVEMRTGSLAEVTQEKGKFLWGSSSFILNLAMMWCTAISGIAIRQFSDSFKRSQRLWIFSSFGLLSIVLASLGTRGGLAGRAGRELLARIANRGVTKFVDLNNVVAPFVVVLLVLAFVFVSRGTEEASARSLSGRIHWFNLLLYSGSAVLAAAVYEVYWLFQWGAAGQESLQAFASSVAVGGGIVFSSLLLLIVGPPAIRLNRRLDILVSESANISDFDPQKWLLKQGIVSTPLRSLGACIAVLLPAATGLSTKLPGF
jgi:hypothetical protein